MSTQTPGASPPPAPSPASPDRLARQLRVYRTLAFLLLAVLALGAGYFIYVRRLGQPVVVLLDGKPITTVRNAATADALIVQAEQAKVGQAYPPDAIVRLQKVKMRRVASDSALDPANIARAKLTQALKLNVHAYAILVDGHVSVGLPSDEIAADTLHRVKEHFAQMPPDAQILAEPTFLQRVTIKPRAVSSVRARASAEAAAPYFWTAPPSKTYIVQRGDRGVSIARRNHLSLSDLIAANANRNINRLAPGDEINVEKMPLLLTVQVQKQFTREEKILPNVPAAAAGLRRVTYKVTYLNGQEVQREPTSMETITPPVARTSL